MERIEGVAFETVQSPAQARSAGNLLGRVHSALEDFALPLEPLGFPYRRNEHHLAELRRALARHADHPRHADVSDLAREVFAGFQGLRGEAPDLPRRVVHGDLKFNNFLFEASRGEARDRAVALIDFDTLERRTLGYEMGDAWRSWSNRAGEDSAVADLDLVRFRAGAEGWLETLTIPLATDERRSLAEAAEFVSLELCARFAADTLEESYFRWDPERFESHAEHNWVRARGQLSLYRQWVEARADVEAVLSA
jgi:hypothetical protein